MRGFLFFRGFLFDQRGKIGRKQLFQHEIRQQVLREALGHIVPPQDMQAQPLGIGEMIEAATLGQRRRDC